jgi:hypothetical protein
MTKVLFHGSIKGFRGRIGNLIFRQLPDGSTVVTQAPPKKNSRQKKRAKLKRSAHQQAHNSRFQEASAYAKQAAKVHAVYADLAAVTPMKTAYNFALSDWWHAPVIHRIQRRKGCIRVEASDNIMVARVRVTILDEQGAVLEKGEATRTKGNWWKFPSHAAGTKIVAEAWDLAKNKAQLTL